MWFKMNIDGIQVKLQIEGYRPVTNDGFIDSLMWCKCDYSFSSGDWLHYHREHVEVMLACEVKELEEKLTRLLDNKLTETEEMTFLEEDFEFVFHPQKEILGYRTMDISLDWKIFLKYDVYITGNFLSITLDRDEIIRLRDYLSAIIKQQDSDHGILLKRIYDKEDL